MAPVDPRTPCLIGVGQRVWRPPDAGGAAPEPLDMWEEVCRAAAADSGRPGALDQLDSLQIVYCQSWQYDDPPGRLADRLGAAPRDRLYSGIGGTTPQVLVQTAAEAILRGESDLALVTGAECLETRRQMKKAGSVGKEFERMATMGRVTPDLWMEHASGRPVGPQALLDATERALSQAREK